MKEETQGDGTEQPKLLKGKPGVFQLRMEKVARHEMGIQEPSEDLEEGDVVLGVIEDVFIQGLFSVHRGMVHEHNALLPKQLPRKESDRAILKERLAPFKANAKAVWDLAWRFTLEYFGEDTIVEAMPPNTALAIKKGWKVVAAKREIPVFHVGLPEGLEQFFSGCE